MPAASDSALLLASQLRSSSDAELAELLLARDVRGAGIKDFFDLADALLDPVTVQFALSRLDRPTLATLSALAELGTASAAEVDATIVGLGGEPGRAPGALDALARLALAARDGEQFASLGPVAEQLHGWPALGLPGGRELTAAAPAALAPVLESNRGAVDAAAAERALETIGAVAAMIVALDVEPARELARGGLALPDAKRLAAVAGIPLESTAPVLRIAERAGLVERASGIYLSGTAGDDWLARGLGERWAQLARAWVDALSPDVRSLLTSRAHTEWGARLDAYVDWLYPAGGSWMRERVRAFGDDAVLLGIVARDIPSTPGTALLTSEGDAARAMTALLPAEVRSVYVQQDLSVIATGPLAPEVERRLRGLADPESRGLASTWRVSGASLSRALASGWTAADVRAFLREVSLTGVPQPLEYAIAEAEQRFGLVRVAADGDGRARVRSTDRGLLRSLEVDRALAPLGLVADGGDLRSRFDRDLVFFALAEARYPVAAEDPDGTLVVPERRRPARTVATRSDPAADLVARLRATAGDPVETQEAWLARQLDVAIRSRQSVLVTVLMPDGSTADYRLEPSSVAGGRLRGRDRRADLERTLPLSRITNVRDA